MACLVWDSPKGRVVHTLERSIVIVGSDRVSDLCISDPSVSKRHALIQVDNGNVKITDLGSDGGTKINGASLVPELPSTIEAGDFINIGVGGVVLTFHHTPPPSSAPVGTATTASMTTRTATFPWKWIAVGLGVLLVGCLGALIALSIKGGGGDDLAKGGKEGMSDPAPAKTGNGKPGGMQPKKSGQKPVEKPDVPELPQIIEEIPPNRYASVANCPDMIETHGNGFIPAKIEGWDIGTMTVVGADGKRYRFRRNEAQRIVDRADLARRARKRIERQPIEEIKNCFLLAQWCFARHVRAPLKPFLKRIVADRPDDPVKKFLKAIEAEEKDSS